MLLYLAQEGRGIGLLNKLRAYRLQEDGLDTVEANERLGLPADLRDYGIGAQILADLGLSSIRILTNNPKKIRGLEGYGLSVSAQIPIEHAPNEHNEAYLRTKAQRMGHTLHHQGLNLDEELLHAEREHDRAVADDRTARRGAARATDARPARAARAVSETLRDRRRALLRGARRASASPARGGVRASRRAERSRCSTSPAPSSCRSRRATRPRSGRFAGVACLGAVIRGETDHYDFVCAEAARGVMQVQLETGVPCAFGVLTCETMEQALARSGGGKRDQGRHAAEAVLRMAALRRRARERLDCARWQRYVTAAGRVRRSVRAAATRWSRPSGASTRTCRRSDPRRQGAQARVRLHALSESRQGHQGRLIARLDRSPAAARAVAAGVTAPARR